MGNRIIGFFLAVFVFLGIIVWRIATGERDETEVFKTENVAEYLEAVAAVEPGDASSDFVLYPQELPEAQNITACFFSKETGLFDTYYQMYMVCGFTEEEYEAELERIRAVAVQKGAVVQTPLYTETGFAYPAYVAIFTERDDEYVLLDRENLSMIYVYNRIADINGGNIPSEYLPSGYEVPVNNMQMENGYNMYYFDGARAYE